MRECRWSHSRRRHSGGSRCSGRGKRLGRDGGRRIGLSELRGRSELLRRQSGSTDPCLEIGIVDRPVGDRGNGIGGVRDRRRARGGRCGRRSGRGSPGCCRRLGQRRRSGCGGRRGSRARLGYWRRCGRVGGDWGRRSSGRPGTPRIRRHLRGFASLGSRACPCRWLCRSDDRRGGGGRRDALLFDVASRTTRRNARLLRLFRGATPRGRGNAPLLGLGRRRHDDARWGALLSVARRRSSGPLVVRHGWSGRTCRPRRRPRGAFGRRCDGFRRTALLIGCLDGNH